MKTNRNIHAISLKLFGNIHDSGQAFSVSAHLKVPAAIKKYTRKIKYFALFVFIIASFNILFTTQATAACYPKFKIINDSSDKRIGAIFVCNASRRDTCTTNIMPQQGDGEWEYLGPGEEIRRQLTQSGMSAIANINGTYPQYYILQIEYATLADNYYDVTFPYANTCTFMTYTLH